MHKRMWGIMGNMACCSPGVQVLSMRDAVFIVSPKMLNLGSLLPTTPLTQGPVWMPMRITTGVPSFGIRTCGSGVDVRAAIQVGSAHMAGGKNDDGSGRVLHPGLWGRATACRGQNAPFYTSTHLL